MSFFAVLGRSLVWLWPFISEIFFDNKSFRQLARENKYVFLLLLALSLSLFFNYLSISTVHHLINTTDRAPVTPTPVITRTEQDEDTEEIYKRLNKIYK